MISCGCTRIWLMTMDLYVSKVTWDISEQSLRDRKSNVFQEGFGRTKKQWPVILPELAYFFQDPHVQFLSKK